MNAKHEHCTPPGTLEAYIKDEMAKGAGLIDFTFRATVQDDGRVFIYMRPVNLRREAPYCTTTGNMEVKGNLVVFP